MVVAVALGVRLDLAGAGGWVDEPLECDGVLI